jgi:hypothetical protein
VVWNQSYNPTSNPNTSDEVVWNQSYKPTSNTLFKWCERVIRLISHHFIRGLDVGL